jgi:hypothetical protein
MVATFVYCVDDEDKSVFGDARKVVDELKEERVVHRPWRQVWVVTKAFHHEPSKIGEDYGEFVDKRW